MRLGRGQEALDRYVAGTDGPLTILAAAMIPLLVIPFAIKLSDPAERALLTVDYAIWAVFAVDYAARLYLAPQRWRFARSHPADLLIVAIPMLRPLRAFRSARALRLLRATRLLGFVVRGVVQARAVLRRRGLNYVLLIVVVLALVAAALVLEFEKGIDGANIASFPDALWWVATTITTVGYGDRFPVSAAGRGVAVGLMITGVALLGIITANIAAFFVESEQRADPTLEGMAAVRDDLRALHDRLDGIEARLAEGTLRGGDHDDAGG